jgi:hypothetical protein
LPVYGADLPLLRSSTIWKIALKEALLAASEPAGFGGELSFAATHWSDRVGPNLADARVYEWRLTVKGFGRRAS